MSDEKLPPFSEPAEKGVLGGLLRHPAGMDWVSGIIEPDSFFSAYNGEIFKAMLELHRTNRRIDLVTVFEFLRDHDSGRDKHLSTYLAELWDAVPTGANVEWHAQIVQQKAVQRSLIHLGNVIVRDAQDGIAPADQLLADAEAALAQLRLKGGRGELPATMGQSVDEAIRRIDERAKRPNAGAVTTGFEMLDRCLVGFFPGELVCIAARQGVGKSSFAQAIGVNAASVQHKHVLLTSLEMSRVDIAQRILVNESGVPNWLVRSSRIDESQSLALGSAAGRLRDARFWFDDEPGLTVSRLMSKCRVLKRRLGLDLLIVDYLHLLRPDDVRQPRHEQIGSMSRALKRLAGELQIPVIILSQLNRLSEQENRQPRLSDLSGSDAIGSDCDTILFLHRPNDERERGKPDPVDVIVGKQRNGETGLFRLSYVGHLFRYVQDIPQL